MQQLPVALRLMSLAYFTKKRSQIRLHRNTKRYSSCLSSAKWPAKLLGVTGHVLTQLSLHGAQKEFIKINSFPKGVATTIAIFRLVVTSLIFQKSKT